MAVCSNCKKMISPRATKCRFCYTEQIPNFESEEITLTSTNSIEGYEIIEYCGFIYGEIVCPNGILGALTNGTFFTFSAMAEARQAALEDLKAKARSAKGNAIIGLDIDITDLNGNGILVSANGTAVYCIPDKFEEKKKQFEIIKKEIAEREKMEIQLKEQRLESHMKILEDADGTQMDKTVLKIVIKQESVTALDIVKMLPKSVSPTDISSTLNKLVSLGIIDKTENGGYISKGIADE